ncbi:urea transporter [Dactylosporangium salmoneum]|uniref:Urea transporter n=1 Tax=Dactylosporangium salmoneum TaxID=53361 RepID=A0ABP5SL55_9ACTN
MRLAVRFATTLLRGASQVYLQNHPATGALFLLAIAWAAASGHDLDIIIGAVVGLAVGTVTAILLDVEVGSVGQGLYGFNALLTGIALPTFLPNTAHLWILLVAGTAVTAIITLAIGNIAQEWGVPPLTSPFVLTTWLLLLAAYQFRNAHAASLGPPRLPSPIDAHAAHANLTPGSFCAAVLRGVAQVSLLDNWGSGLFILAGLAVSSAWAAVYALGGSLVATLYALWVGADAGLTTKGLYAFSAVLTAVALGTVFYPVTGRTAVYALLGTLFAVVVQAALDTALSPVGVATLTAPFVVATWLFLIPARDHAPIIGHTRLRDRLLSPHDGPPPES